MVQLVRSLADDDMLPLSSNGFLQLFLLFFCFVVVSGMSKVSLVSSLYCVWFHCLKCTLFQLTEHHFAGALQPYTVFLA